MKIGTIKWQPQDHLATFLIRKQIKIEKEKEYVLARRAKDFDPDIIEIEFENKDWEKFWSAQDINQKWDLMEGLILEVIDDQCLSRSSPEQLQERNGSVMTCLKI